MFERKLNTTPFYLYLVTNVSSKSPQKEAAWCCVWRHRPLANHARFICGLQYVWTNNELRIIGHHCCGTRPGRQRPRCGWFGLHWFGWISLSVHNVANFSHIVDVRRQCSGYRCTQHRHPRLQWFHRIHRDLDQLQSKHTVQLFFLFEKMKTDIKNDGSWCPNHSSCCHSLKMLNGN